MSSNNISVTLASKDDMPSIVPLVQEYYEAFFKRSISEESAINLLDTPRPLNKPILLAKQSGTIIGYAGSTIQEEFCTLSSLFTSEHFRNQGIGTKLGQAQIEHARKSGCCSIQGNVYEDALAALHIYDKLGYEKYPNCNLVVVRKCLMGGND